MGRVIGLETKLRVAVRVLDFRLLVRFNNLHWHWQDSENATSSFSYLEELILTRMEGERGCTVERAEKVVIGGDCESVERKSLN